MRLSAPIFVDEKVLAAAGFPAVDEAALERELTERCAKHGEEPPPGEWRSLTPDLMPSCARRPDARLVLAMPIYEYACMECESHFEELVRVSDGAPSCPACGASNVLRQLSVFAAHGGPGELPSYGRTAGGGCCGGSCGCH